MIMAFITFNVNDFFLWAETIEPPLSKLLTEKKF